MSYISLRAVFVVAVVLLALGSSGFAQTQVVDFDTNDLATYEPESSDLGNYFVLSVTLPKSPADAELMDAYLDIYVDAAHRLADSFKSSAVTLEVFGLTGELQGEVDQSKVRHGSMKATVREGENQSVRIYANEFVRHVLANPQDNHGLVIGSITGDRTGVFDVKTGGIAAGKVARLTLIYKPKVPGTRDN